MINPSTLKVPSTFILAQAKPTSSELASKSNMLTLSNGAPVREALYNDIFNQVMHRHLYLKQGFAYTTEEICGTSFWRSLSSGDCKAAGKCMCDLVKLSRVPFIVAETAHEYPKEYTPVSR